MKPDINTSITNQNVRLTEEHAEFNTNYSTSKNNIQKHSLLKTYQKKLENINGQRILLIDIATGGKNDEVTNKLKSLFFLDKIDEWIRALPKEGGSRRKHTRRRVSRLRNKKTLRNIRRRR